MHTHDTDDDPDRYQSRDGLTDLIGRLCDDDLPRLAQGSDMSWPVHLDHCFRRLAYDNAVCRHWITVVDRPFTANASIVQLNAAATQAARLKQGGSAYAWRLQERSMLWRDKIDPDECEHVDPADVPNLP